MRRGPEDELQHLVDAVDAFANFSFDSPVEAPKSAAASSDPFAGFMSGANDAEKKTAKADGSESSSLFTTGAGTDDIAGFDLPDLSFMK